jgi:hypothetical protein
MEEVAQMIDTRELAAIHHRRVSRVKAGCGSAS